MYTAVLSLDHVVQDPNWSSRLLTAIEAAGWEYVPTSSVVLDGSASLEPVLIALDILSRALEQPGHLTMLALQAEFRDRIAAHGTDPEPVRALKERVEP